MVYDCFQFFNEIDILKLRMNILNDIVDKFVISESTVTFSGDEKPLYFEKYRHLFQEFESKIIYNIVDDTPDGNPFERDSFQKCAVVRGLKDAKDEDIIIFSDVDEIPNPEVIRDVLKAFDNKKIYHLAQRMFYCYINLEETEGRLLSVTGEFDGVEKRKWLGTKICSKRILANLTLEQLRNKEQKSIGIRIENGGWHFGYMGGDNQNDVNERIAYKIKSAAHQEFNNDQVLAGIAKKINQKRDILGRNVKFKRVPIDETYPKYLLEHLEEYKHLILPSKWEEFRNKLK